MNPDENGCGELAVAGPGIFDAYVAPWIPREQVLRDGWFFTGDIGRLDADGFLFLLSRKTAVINLAGRKVFPEEIEAVLNRHPAVRESRVYGKPHPHLGEVVERNWCLRNQMPASIPFASIVANIWLPTKSRCATTSLPPCPARRLPARFAAPLRWLE